MFFSSLTSQFFIFFAVKRSVKFVFFFNYDYFLLLSFFFECICVPPLTFLLSLATPAGSAFDTM